VILVILLSDTLLTVVTLAVWLTVFLHQTATPSAKAGKTEMPGRNFPGPVSIDMDHKRIHGHSRDYLVVKFIVNHCHSNKITCLDCKRGHKAFNEMIYYYHFMERILKEPYHCHSIVRLGNTLYILTISLGDGKLEKSNLKFKTSIV
jgi:hypothetical protein